MQFRVGEPVVHWTYGLGKVIAIEERALSGQKTLYYVVEINDLTIWVPVDDKAKARLRPPTSPRTLKRMVKILSAPAKSLAEDRLERKSDLHRRLQDGNVESLCSVIRDLCNLQRKKGLNDDDKTILKRAFTALQGEWGYSFSVPAAQAEQQLYGLLGQPSEAKLV